MVSKVMPFSPLPLPPIPALLSAKSADLVQEPHALPFTSLGPLRSHLLL